MSAWLLKHWQAVAVVCMVLLIVALALFGMQQWTARKNEQVIGALKVEQQRSDERNTKLQADVAVLTAEKSRLQGWAAELEAEIAVAKEANLALQAEAASNQLETRRIDTTQELEGKFAAAYPELAHAPKFGIMDIESDGIKIAYVLMPAWFLDAFIVDHDNLVAAQERITLYDANEARYGKVVDLNHQVIALEARVSTAYRDGYDMARGEADACRTDRITDLRKPRLELPSGWSLGLCVGAGALGGYALDKVMH